MKVNDPPDYGRNVSEIDGFWGIYLCFVVRLCILELWTREKGYFRTRFFVR